MSDSIKTLIEQAKITSADNWEEPFAEAIIKECDVIINSINEDDCDQISENITTLEQIVNLMQLELVNNQLQEQPDCTTANNVIDKIIKL